MRIKEDFIARCVFAPSLLPLAPFFSLFLLHITQGPGQYLTHAHSHITWAVAANCGSISPAFIVLFFLSNLLTNRLVIKADPPSQRMLWENCRAVPSQQLPHVLCGAGTKRGTLHPPRQWRLDNTGRLQGRNSCPWLALPGWYGCALAIVDWCLSVTYFYSVCPIPHFPFLISPFPVLPFLHFSFRSPSLYFPIIIIPPFPLFANRNPRLGHFPVASCLWFKTSLSAKTSFICTS